MLCNCFHIQIQYINFINILFINSHLIMFSLIAQIYQQYFGNREYNVCILGAQESGKTTLFNSIKNIYNIENINHSNQTKFIYKPTVGLNVLKYKYQKDNLTIWDLGGKQNIRKIWQNYYAECHGVIYLLNNVGESIQVLRSILQHQQMAKIPILIIITNLNMKQQIQVKLKQVLSLKNRNYMIHGLELQKFSTSRSIIRQLLHWLYFNISQLCKEIIQ